MDGTFTFPVLQCSPLFKRVLHINENQPTLQYWQWTQVEYGVRVLQAFSKTGKEILKERDGLTVEEST